MDVAKAFTFITEDERWTTKIGLGVLVMLASTIFLLIPLPLLVGYQLGVTRNVMNDEKRPLPEWDDLGRLFIDGLYIILARIIYTLPFILLMCIGFAVAFLPAIGSGTGSDELTSILGGVTAIVWIVLSCLALLFIVALIFISPAISIQFVRTNDFSACLRFGEVFGIARDHIADILIVLGVLLLANIVLQSVVGALAATVCGIVIALPLSWVGYAWFSASSGHMYGQIAAKGSSVGMEKQPDDLL